MFARTERLLLRPAWEEDAPALFRAIAHEEIVRNLARAPWPYSLADAETFVAAPRSPREPTMLVFRRTGGAPILAGGVGLGRSPCGGIELGYWIAKPFWGQGYATEAAGAMIDIARDSLRGDRLVSGHFLDNPASGRVLRKLGFKATGAIRARYSAARGEQVPCAEFELELTGRTGNVQPDTACDMMAA